MSKGIQYVLGEKTRIIKSLLIKLNSGMKLFVKSCLVFRYMFTECFKKCKFSTMSVLNDGTF